jgi:UTP--glucose-1-phosphate uridylyltransferase
MLRMSSEGLRQAEEKMRAAGQPEAAIRAFARAYERLAAGESAFIRSQDLEAAADVPRLGELPEADPGEALRDVAMIKLNGGLATTMGLRHPKSLVQAKDGKSFLDIIVGQTLGLRQRYGIRVPLLLMNSEATRTDTEQALSRYPELNAGLPVTFMQSIVPKLDAETLEPVSWTADPNLEWAPPGHGDVYAALQRSGILDRLLEEGFRYAMISNIDNLGAWVQPNIAAHVQRDEIPFLMEVVEGTESERKGGHLARRRSDGQLILREVAQTAPEDEASFRDFRRWRYYNTNSLWLDLRVLSEVLSASDGVMDLPLIVNRKTVDPRDPASTPVIQLESAMGAAIQSFTGAKLLCVPRSRFVPVKTTNDLLLLRSDVYELTGEMVVRPVPERDGKLPFVELDKRVYRVLEQFERRFPAGAPSLREAERLEVDGDVTFGSGVVVRGAVRLHAEQAITIEDGTVLEGG